MAITQRAVGAWAVSNATTQTVTLPTHVTGDMLIVRTIRKPFTSPDNTVINTAGWLPVGTGVANGATGNGVGVGSMGFKAFYKIALSSAETNPVVTWGVTAAPGAAVGVSYQKDAADTWVTPTGTGGGDATARTSQTSTMSSHISVTTGDVVDFFRGQCDDSGALTVPTITQTGVTFDAVTESPAAALLDATSNDIAADGGYRTATAGTSSAAAVITGTSAASEEHGAWQTRLRVIPTISATFTANAVLKATISATFTANAVIRRSNQPGSFTADAVLSRAQTATFTANGVIRRAASGSYTANAITKRTQSGSFTADAMIGRVIVDSPFPLGTNPGWGAWHIEETGTGVATTESGTAQLLVPAGTLGGVTVTNIPWSDYGMLEIRVGIQNTVPAEVAAHAVELSVYQLIPGTRNFIQITYDNVSNGHYHAELSASTVGLDVTNTSDERVIFKESFGPAGQVQALTGQIAGGGPVQTYQDIVPSGDIDPEYVLSVGVEAAVDEDCLVTITVFRITTFSADPFHTRDEIDADAVIRKTQSGSFTANAVLVVPQSGSFTGEAVLRRITTASVIADAAILRTQSHTFDVDALVRRAASATVTADAVVRATLTSGLAADAVLRKTVAASFSADAALLATRMAGFAADAVFLSPRTQSLTADAVVLQSRTGVLTVDATVQRTQSATLAADAILRSERTATLEAAAVLRSTANGAFTADAFLVAPGVGAGSVTADAVIRATRAQGITADAVLRIARTGTFVTDALLRRNNVGALTSDAVLRAARANLVTANAVLRATRSETIIADAIARRTIASSFAGSAALRRAMAGSFTADAAISISLAVTASFTMDAVITTGVFPAIHSTIGAAHVSSTLAADHVHSVLDPVEPAPPVHSVLGE